MVILLSFKRRLAALQPAQEPRLAALVGRYYEATPFDATWPPTSWGDSDWHVAPSGNWVERHRPQSHGRISLRSVQLAGTRGSLSDMCDMHALRKMVESGELIVRSLRTEGPGLHLDEDAAAGVHRCYEAAANEGLAPPLLEGDHGPYFYSRPTMPLPSRVPEARPAVLAAWNAVHTSASPEAAVVDTIMALRAPRHSRTPRVKSPACKWPAPLWAGGQQ